MKEIMNAEKFNQDLANWCDDATMVSFSTDSGCGLENCGANGDDELECQG